MAGFSSEALETGVQFGLKLGKVGWVVVMSGRHVSGGVEALFLLTLRYGYLLVFDFPRLF